MRKGHSIIGLQVIAASDGAHLGKVLDLVFDHDADQCLGLVLREKDLFGLIKPQMVPWLAISSIGKDAVVVTDSNVVVNPNEEATIRAVWQRPTALSGTKIFTEDGRDLGTFSEVYLDENSGKVVGYEVSGGFVSDTMSGKRYVPAENVGGLHTGDDVLIADASIASEFNRQETSEPGGIKGALSNVSNKASQSYDSTKAELANSYNNGVEALNNSIRPAHPEAPTVTDTDYVETTPIHTTAATTVPDKLEQCIGQRSALEVNLPNGQTLLAPGMTITRETVERAREYGQEDLVIAAAGLGPTAHINYKGGSSVGEAATNAWEAIKNKTEELFGVATDKKAERNVQAEQKQINRALGRPVTRIILSRDDSIILNAGDIITHKSIDLAREAGMLDVLLDSVYDATPEINPEMGRATQSGHAALETQPQTTPAAVSAFANNEAETAAPLGSR